MSRQAGQTFDATEQAPAAARRFVRECLSAWDLTTAIEPVVLAVSELVTNAVIHGQGPVALVLRADGDRIRVAVDDEGGGTPVMRQPDAQARVSGGWGLQMLDRLADDWGADTEEHRTTVWFERQLRPADSELP